MSPYTESGQVAFHCSLPENYWGVRGGGQFFGFHSKGLSCLRGSDCGLSPAGLQAKVAGRSTVLHQPIEQIRMLNGVDQSKMDGRQVFLWGRKQAEFLRKAALFCREIRQ